MKQKTILILLAVFLLSIVSPSYSGTYEYYIHKGEKAKKLRKYKAAYGYFLEAKNSAPNSDKLVYALGSLCVAANYLGNKKEASKHLQEIIKIEPFNDWAYSYGSKNGIYVPPRKTVVENINYNIQRNKVLLIMLVVLIVILYHRKRSMLIAKRIYKIYKSVVSFSHSSKNVVKTIMKKNQASIFISYSHADKTIINNLKKHLKYYEHKKQISTWDDSKIRTGMLWRKEINDALRSAKVAILLVSSDFLASDFIMKYELPTLLNSAKLHGTKILPVIVTPCAYEDSELVEFQAFNTPDKPLIGLSRVKKEELYAMIAKEVKNVVINEKI